MVHINYFTNINQITNKLYFYTPPSTRYVSLLTNIRSNCLQLLWIQCWGLSVLTSDLLGCSKVGLCSGYILGIKNTFLLHGIGDRSGSEGVEKITFSPNWDQEYIKCF